MNPYQSSGVPMLLSRVSISYVLTVAFVDVPACMRTCVCSSVLSRGVVALCRVVMSAVLQVYLMLCMVCMVSKPL